MVKIRIFITTRNEEDAKITYKKLQEKLLAANMSHSGVIPLPHQRKKIVINRSPHVFSKSKEEFYTIIRKYLIVVHLKDKENLASLIKNYNEWCPASVSLTLKAA
ncbi:MAG: uS10/mL48 family ribosomal protein [Pseudomonadota bacterium]